MIQVSIRSSTACFAELICNSLQQASSRREQVSAARKVIERVPCRELFELSGRPSVAYQVLDYHDPDGRKLARFDLPFLFKAFETGQPAPPRAGTKNAAKPRAATIHEYLDWTVTAEEPKQPSDLVCSVLIMAFTSDCGPLPL